MDPCSQKHPYQQLEVIKLIIKERNPFTVERFGVNKANRKYLTNGEVNIEETIINKKTDVANWIKDVANLFTH